MFFQLLSWGSQVLSSAGESFFPSFCLFFLVRESSTYLPLFTLQFRLDAFRLYFIVLILIRFIICLQFQLICKVSNFLIFPRCVLSKLQYLIPNDNWILFAELPDPICFSICFKFLLFCLQIYLPIGELDVGCLHVIIITDIVSSPYVSLIINSIWISSHLTSMSE